MAAVAMTASPPMTGSAIPPQVPILRNVFAPQRQSSSTAMAADGPPIPVDVTLTLVSPMNPVYVVNSL